MFSWNFWLLHLSKTRAESYRKKRTAMEFSVFTWLPSLCSTVTLTGKTTEKSIYGWQLLFWSVLTCCRNWGLGINLSSTRFSGFSWRAIVKLLGWLNCQRLSSLQPDCCALSVPHWCPWGSRCSTCEHQDCVTARPAMVCLITSTLKILDVAKMPTTSRPFDLRFMSGSRLIILQTSANFSYVLKT